MSTLNAPDGSLAFSVGGHGYSAQTPSFNSSCPYHTRRCKCSIRFALRRKSARPGGPGATSVSHGVQLSTPSSESKHNVSTRPVPTYPSKSPGLLAASSGRETPWQVVGYTMRDEVETTSGRPDVFVHPKGLRLVRHASHKGSKRSDHERIDNYYANAQKHASASNGGIKLITTGTDQRERPASFSKTPIASFSSSLACREQLWSGFLGFYLPQDLPQANELIARYHQCFTLDCETVAMAIDSCTMFHYAAVTKDERASQAADQAHGTAVRQLRTELVRPNAAFQDAIICTICALAMCCRMRWLENSDETHYDGLMAVLRLRGSVAVQSQLVRDLVLDLLPRALTLAVQRRRKFLFGEPEWQHALAEYCADSPIKQIVLISCRIPNILAAGDTLPSRGGDGRNEELGSMLSEMESIQAALEQVRSSWYGTSSDPPYCTVEAYQRFPKFFARTKEWSVEDVFDLAFDFRTPQDAVYHNWCCVALLNIYRSKLDLLELCFAEGYFPSDVSRDLQRQSLTTQCTELANEICQTVPFICSEPCIHRFRSSLWNQVFYAQQWFERARAEREVDWCSALSSELREEANQANSSCGTASIDQVFSGWMMLLT